MDQDRGVNLPPYARTRTVRAGWRMVVPCGEANGRPFLSREGARVEAPPQPRGLYRLTLLAHPSPLSLPARGRSTQTAIPPAIRDLLRLPPGRRLVRSA
jgi:hypothetical protein